MRIKTGRFFIALILLFLITRTALIVFAPSDLFRDSEFSRGTIAKEIIEGPSWPLYLYQNESFNGGTLFAGIFLCPFFLLFGQNFLAIKLAALLFSSLTFTVLYLWLRRSFNERIAALTALSFIFAPTAFIAYSVILMGEHFESIFFTVSALLLLYRIFLEGNAKRDLKEMAFFGMVCGLGVWFCYTFLITLATCLICWVILDRLFFLKKEFLVFGVGGLAGFSPWIWYNSHMGFSGMMIKGRCLFDHFSLSSISDRFLDFLTQYFPGVFYFGGGNSGPLFPWFSYFYLFSFLLTFVFLSVRMFSTKDKRLLPLFVYPVVYLAVFLMSDFKASSPLDTPSYKYLFPFFMFIFISVAFFVDTGLSALRNGFKKMALLLIFVIFPATILFAQELKMLSFDSPGHQLRTHKPYSYELLGSSVAINMKGDFPKQVKYIQMIRPQHRGYAYRGLGVDLWYDLAALRSLDLEKFKLIEPQYRADFYRGFGMGLFFLDAPPVTIENIPEEYRKYCFEAAGIVAGMQGLDLAHKVPKPALAEYYFGLGEGVFWRFKDHIRSIKTTINRIDKQYRKSYLNGLVNGAIYCETCNPEKADFDF